ETSTAPVPWLRRYGMAAAAAALILAAYLFAPADKGGEPRVLHGDAVTAGGGVWRCTRVSRLTVPGGITLTLDEGTDLVLTGNRRLALRAGRFFFEGAGDHPDFLVEAPGLLIRTVGTAFLVEIEGGGVRVAVTEGKVVCRHRDREIELGPGRALRAAEEVADAPSDASRERAWFTTPSLQAELVDRATLRVVVRNEMPDPIRLVPPTGGEPLLFAGYGGHNYPLRPEQGEELHPGGGTVVLAPGEARTQTFRLAVPVPEGESTVVVMLSGHNVRVSARAGRAAR
ncbi:MAG: FecR domain-containing protein, partial [Planctomycetaceae bacterium]